MIPLPANIKLYAACGLVLAVALGFAACGARIATLHTALATSQGDTQTVKRQLADRIAAEAEAVSAAVQAARREEQTSTIQVQEKYDALKKVSAADAANFVTVRDRLRQLAAGPAARSSGVDVPGAASTAQRAAEASGDGSSPEDRSLIDGLLQLAGEAAESGRQRNFAVDQYQVNCAR